MCVVKKIVSQIFNPFLSMRWKMRMLNKTRIVSFFEFTQKL